MKLRSLIQVSQYDTKGPHIYKSIDRNVKETKVKIKEGLHGKVRCFMKAD